MLTSVMTRHGMNDKLHTRNSYHVTAYFSCSFTGLFANFIAKGIQLPRFTQLYDGVIL
ncbi:MAG TPA: hypothetical protein VIZ28_20035 [Chitinophagaceae bacterium]